MISLAISSVLAVGFAFLKNDNTAITIGRAAEGGEGSTTHNLINVKKVFRFSFLS